MRVTIVVMFLLYMVCVETDDSPIIAVNIKRGAILTKAQWCNCFTAQLRILPLMKARDYCDSKLRLNDFFFKDRRIIFSVDCLGRATSTAPPSTTTTTTPTTSGSTSTAPPFTSGSSTTSDPDTPLTPLTDTVHLYWSVPTTSLLVIIIIGYIVYRYLNRSGFSRYLPWWFMSCCRTAPPQNF